MVCDSQDGSELVANSKPADYLKMILTSRVYDVAEETPLTRATNLSRRYGVNFLLKREDLQPVFSFKIRGAYNRIAHLTADERKRGIIAASAGNHAQGVAYAARKLGIKATIVMPTCTPSIKYKNVEALGAQVVLHGNDFDEAKVECRRLVSEFGYVDIPPYDDPYVIAGQGTVAAEIMRQSHKIQPPIDLFPANLIDSTIHHDNIEAIFCAVGGGGLIAGIVAYVKQIYPHVKVIGVEAHDANAMHQSLQQNDRILLDKVGLFADGAAVKQVGKENFRICAGMETGIGGVDEVVLVDNDEICAAIRDIFNDTRTVMEPAGALGVAGLKKWLSQQNCNNEIIRGGNYVAVTSGANMNFDRLRFVAERAALGDEREALISVRMPETPGSFMRLYEVIHPRAVTEFSYRYGNPRDALVLMSFEVRQDRSRPNDLLDIFNQLEARGMKCFDLSTNEIAKSHARYMVGGRVLAANERVFQFSFPERPGALQQFLSGIQADWNVSLFHYRNYGADVGKVLVGVQVSPEAYEAFDRFLNELEFPYTEETDNPVYQQFLNLI